MLMCRGGGGDPVTGAHPQVGGRADPRRPDTGRRTRPDIPLHVSWRTRSVNMNTCLRTSLNSPSANCSLYEVWCFKCFGFNCLSRFSLSSLSMLNVYIFIVFCFVFPHVSTNALLSIYYNTSC